jgi:site-specific recombinase XerD
MYDASLMIPNPLAKRHRAVMALRAHHHKRSDEHSGMRDYTEAELELVRKSFGGSYALRDRRYFEVALQMGLRVSEMLSIRVGQDYQFGKVVDEVSIERKHLKGGKAGKASGCTIPLFPDTKPHILAWLQRVAGMLKVQNPTAIDPATPLFMSRIRHQDGSRRAIARETAWRIIKGIARENEFSGKVGTHSTRKTLARRVFEWAKDIRVVQRILGHRSLSSTEAYLQSLTDREVWTAFGRAAA